MTVRVLYGAFLTNRDFISSAPVPEICGNIPCPSKAMRVTNSAHSFSSTVSDTSASSPTQKVFIRRRRAKELPIRNLTVTGQTASSAFANCTRPTCRNNSSTVNLGYQNQPLIISLTKKAGTRQMFLNFPDNRNFFDRDISRSLAFVAQIKNAVFDFHEHRRARLSWCRTKYQSVFPINCFKNSSIFILRLYADILCVGFFYSKFDSDLPPFVCPPPPKDCSPVADFVSDETDFSDAFCARAAAIIAKSRVVSSTSFAFRRSLNPLINPVSRSPEINSSSSTISLKKRHRCLDAADFVFPQSAAQTINRFRARFAENGEFGNHRIVINRNFRAFVNAAVVAHAVALRNSEARDFSRRRQKIIFRVFGINAALDGVRFPI